MVNHGLSTSALFIMVGMIGERIDSRDFADLGGLWGKMPVFSVFFLFFALASMGLPGLNNFVGEILILVGIFQARPLIGILSFGGLVFTVIYILRMVKDTLFGEPKKAHAWVDVNAREVVILVIMALPILFIGLHPGPALRLLEQPVQHLLAQVSFLAMVRYGEVHWLAPQWRLAFGEQVALKAMRSGEDKPRRSLPAIKRDGSTLK